MFQWCLYRKKRNASQHIIDLVDGLEETYYIADVLPKPKEFQNEAYYYALKKACKSMNDEIGKITEEKQDYQEYVESFAHEIKIPIGALSLTFDNTKNYTLKKETDKIFQLVEQMLYYARSENTEKDYFVKQLQLDEVIHNVILKFRHSLMERKTIINIHDIENVIYTDEKWLTFILSQIVQNAIKYFDKQENKLTIYSQDNGTNILLVIEDNGCGIKASDLSRLKKVVRHVVKDYQQGLKRRKDKEIPFCELPEIFVENFAVRDDYETDYTIFSVCGIDIRVLDDELAEALKKLPERKRNTLLMYYFLEMTESEIANLQKITQSGVFRNRHHALETMKKILKEKQ